MNCTYDCICSFNCTPCRLLGLISTPRTETEHNTFSSALSILTSIHKLSYSHYRIKYSFLVLVFSCTSNCSTRIEIFAVCYTHYTLQCKQLNSSVHNTLTSIIPALLLSFPQSPLRRISMQTVFCCNDTNRTYKIPYSGVTDFYTIPLNTNLPISNKSYKCWHVPYFILRSISVHRKP
jgi:hypothetical protein